ncbi:queuine tRNA-ribosyltransferase (plasmid) [Kalymmatonema gypsitolerans NIES-4073]|uniref:tRNA-guanine transglycosylase DpdA n=1 Tax=Nostoc sp. LEGE 06077 TaxID=915325 RepID=UPI000B5FBA25|nr:tRNA-guanine transglycosylase DpdA [Nostoc sp. LEGE 06077]BAZ19259.1 queuine tRNA-ribosyltransferase [Scytonema sp. NIES-4073]
MTKSIPTKTLVSTSTISRLRTLIITSCTGKKLHNPTNQLTIEDFKDTERLRERTQSLSEFSCPSGQMYTGLQHLRLMEGVDILRSHFGREVVDVKIISAAYGLIPEDKVIVPYSVTFNSMKSDEISSWANFIGIHKDFQEAVIGYDLVFVLLGDKYIRALNLPIETHPKQTFIFLASNKSRNLLVLGNANFEVLTFSNADASRFGCALVGLKGQLIKLIATEIRQKPNLLSELYNNPKTLEKVLNNQPQQLELPLGISVATAKKSNIKNKKPKRAIANLDEFLNLPRAVNTHLRMKYFIPEWDDKVDIGYNFLLDESSLNRNAYRDDVYAHEIYSQPNYDGILVSKVVVDKIKNKRADIEKLGGIRNFVRFPGEIMGDCGAFGYIKQEVPPYNTVEILDYYEKLQFNYGVSIDHLIVGPFAEPGVREKRYDLTLQNAEEFISKHQKIGYTFTPIGVAQGWNPETYADAVKKLVEMGYDYIAIGGVARTPTIEILEILKEVYQHLTPNTRLHLFGVGRIDALPYFRHLGVTSFDSASPLRKAWFDAVENYHTLSGKAYAAVRIPFVDKQSPRIKHLLLEGYERETLRQLEQEALKAIREYDKDNISLDESLEKLLAYDELLELPRDGKVTPTAKARRLRQHTQLYRELLEVKPWQECECKICKDYGVETAIFRGNDRNRRRGFHNTYVFYQRFQEFLSNENHLENYNVDTTGESI